MEAGTEAVGAADVRFAVTVDVIAAGCRAAGLRAVEGAERAYLIYLGGN